MRCEGGLGGAVGAKVSANHRWSRDAQHQTLEPTPHPPSFTSQEKRADWQAYIDRTVYKQKD